MSDKLDPARSAIPDAPPSLPEEGHKLPLHNEGTNWAAIGMALAVVIVGLVFGIVS